MEGIKFNSEFLQDLSQSSTAEFLETNNIGLYSSSTVAGLNTRKYHGVLVARQPQLDHHSYVLLNALHETVTTGKSSYELGAHQYPMVVTPKGYLHLESFDLSVIPTWKYKVEDCLVQKELLCVDNSNQVLIRYTLLKGATLNISLKPFSSFRRIHKLQTQSDQDISLKSIENGIQYSIDDTFDAVHIQTSKFNEFEAKGEWHKKAEYLIEQDRGYDFQEDLYSVGELSLSLIQGESFVVSAATKITDASALGEQFEVALSEKKKLESLDDYLDKAAQQFLSDTDKGTEVCAGYHWFGRWGRDTFLSLPGLTISRNQPEICKQVLKTMLKDLKGGLLTNIGVGAAARYNSADASLWFFWALQEYVDATNSASSTWEEFKEEIQHILSNYKKGTLYNIHMKESGLLYGGQFDVALTWMDAMVDGLPVTPRAGYTVELNALWYHAICFSLEMAEAAGDATFVQEWKGLPEKIKVEFKNMFWDASKGYLADACEEEEKDWSFRPNQAFATSLKYSVCDAEMSKSILTQIEQKLLTPRGLRTLSQDDEKYIGIYKGDQKTRDNSYHQGIVWPWLLGHFAAGYAKVDPQNALPLLLQIYNGFEEDLKAYGIGSIAEIYDAESPYAPKGTISQAWSVSELIRIQKLIVQLKENKN